MSLNHLVKDNSFPLNVEVNDLKVHGTLEFNGSILDQISSGTYITTVSANNNVTATIDQVAYHKIGKIVKLTALVSVSFASVVSPGNDTFTVSFGALPGTKVSGAVIYGTATGGASTFFTTGDSPGLVGIYAGTPTLTTVSMELRHTNNQKTSSAHLDSTVGVEITYEDTTP